MTRPEDDDVLVLPADPDQPVPYTVVDTAAKGTRTAGEPTLSSDVLDLLAAIRDTADVPLPTIDPADERAWHNLMQRRLGDLHAVLDTVLRPEWVDILDPAREAADIRARLAAAPVTYDLYVQGAAPDACTVCRRPFDPADTRWDGAARHGDSDFCRACVDRCHDSEIADHRCPVCAGDDVR